MKVLYNWIKEYVDIPVSAKKLAEDLGLFGHEVDEVRRTGNDYVMDFEITANRGDCLSILGMAREAAALYNLKLKAKKEKVQLKIKKLNKKININISKEKICPRFTARIIDNINIKESPDWIKQKLKLYGFKSINNIVDITNLVMIEMGQPLHAFDAAKLKYANIHKSEHKYTQILIRQAKKGESIITLDGQKRKLDENTIVMDDGKKIFDLAGIMGGLNSEIDIKTKTIILQGSVFDPILVRRTAKRLKLTTDASYRFERKIDYQGTIRSVNRAAELIQKCCSEAKIGKLIDIKSAKPKEQKIKIDINKINTLIGKKFSKSTIVNYLQRLHIICKNNVCEVPSYRLNDLIIWQALAGEIARLYGFDKLPRQQIKSTKSKANIEFIKKENMEFIKKEFIKDILVQNAFTEIYSYSFADEKLLRLLGIDLKNCRYVINSVTPENKYLRPNLESSILSAVAKNPWAPEVNVFEIGKVFSTTGEKWQLGTATTNKEAKNIKKVLNLLNIRTDIISVNQNVLDYLKIRKPVKYVTIDLDKIDVMSKQYKEKFKNIKYKPISGFPPTIRDLAFIVNKNIKTDKVKETIQRISQNILLVELFDEFESDKLGKDKKSIAYHIWLQNLKKPMSDKKTKTIINSIISELAKKFGAELRG